MDDGVEGDRAFAQAPDHRVAAGLDPLGDGDLALAGEQFDRAHLAKIHADGIVGAVDRLLLLLDDEALAVRAVAFLGAGIGLGLLRFVLVVVGFLGFDDIHTHFIQGAHHVLDLVGGHLVLGQGFVELVVSDVAALLGAGDKLLERGLVEVDQRRVAVVLLIVRLGLRVRLRHLNALCSFARAALDQRRKLSLRLVPRRSQPLLLLKGGFVAFLLEPGGRRVERG